MNDILLSIFLGLLIFLIVMLIVSLLNDMGGLFAILHGGKKKETKEENESKIANGVDLNDISLDCVINIDAVESHIDSTLSCLKRELNYCEPDTRRNLYKLPFNTHYSCDTYATCLHKYIDELIKYTKLFDRLNHQF